MFLCCKKWLTDAAFPLGLNDTNVVLIPKKENADEMKDLRPIALCNVLYKVIEKVLANRLKSILPGIITDNQSAFVPGRSITDNMLLAFELLHYMKQKKKGAEGVVALKLDVSKAYDRVDWGFLMYQMKQLGFDNKWITWMQLCVTTVSYTVNFNGTQIGPINPSRGLRQGDPLSPYLFLFCVEGLSRMIQKSANEGKVQGCRICMQAPAITHLLFADDSFLFCRLELEEVMEVKTILQKYELHSGQAINLQKSGIYFSSNVRVDKQEEVKNVLGVYNDLSTGKYLGLPSLIGRSKKTTFNFLKDRLWSKLQGWAAKSLSKAGKAVLLRTVAQTIPSYAMSCFLLPKSLCAELERMMNSCWWGSQGNSRKGIKWASWTNMSMAKELVGLAFRDLQGFNLALLGKQCWNLLHNPNSLVARVLKARYYPQTSLFEASRGGGVSYVWSGLWQAKETLKQGYRWVVGDGRTISVNKDAWIRGKDGNKVDAQYLASVNDLKVCDLFVSGTTNWDVIKVHSLFSSSDASYILAIPVPINQSQDRVVWCHSTDGKYSAKTGYKFWQNHFSHCRSL